MGEWAIGAGIILVLLIVGGAVAFFLLRSRFRTLLEYERLVVFSISGRFVGVRGPGLVFINFGLVPGGETIDIRDQVVNLPSEQCITADSSVVTIQPAVVYKITDPGKMATEIRNPVDGITSATNASLRAIIGTMTLTEVITGREIIATGMGQRVTEQAQRWGISIINLELQRIAVSAEVERAMNQRRANEESAEAERRTAELRAEAARQQYVVEADAKRQGATSEAEALRTQADAESYAITARAEGEKKAEELRAQGMAARYATLREMGGDVEVALKYEQIQALRTIGESPNAKLVIIPENLSRFSNVGEITRLERAATNAPANEV